MLHDPPLWERPELRAATGDTLRPGGFTLTDRAAETMGVLPGWRVLDVGCGLGATMHRLRSRFGARAFGVEASSGQIGRGSPRGVINASGENLPFADGVFDGVFCECVLSLFHDPEQGMREFHRVLGPEGWLALSDLHAPGGRGRQTGSCADGAVALETTRALVESAGFEVVRVEDHTNLLRDLAARLLFTGEGCGCPGRSGMGYYLMLARKRGCSHV